MCVMQVINKNTSTLLCWNFSGVSALAAAEKASFHPFLSADLE